MSGNSKLLTLPKEWLPYTVRVVDGEGKVLFEQVIDFPKKEDPPAKDVVPPFVGGVPGAEGAVAPGSDAAPKGEVNAET